MLGYGITTPSSLDEDILNFCQKISSEKALFLEVNPLVIDGVRKLFCYENVDIAIKKGLGKQQLGWILWADPKKRFLKAEAHAVLKNWDGKLIDVTPQQDKESKILFLPDNNLIDTGTLIPSKYQSLVDSKEVLNFIKSEIENEMQYKKIYEINKNNCKPETLIKKNKKIKRNDPCPCGSGKKYKKCCLI